MGQYNTIQYNTIQYNTVQYSTVHYTTQENKKTKERTNRKTEKCLLACSFVVGICCVCVSIISVMVCCIKSVKVVLNKKKQQRKEWCMMNVSVKVYVNKKEHKREKRNRETEKQRNREVLPCLLARLLFASVVCIYHIRARHGYYYPEYYYMRYTLHALRTALYRLHYTTLHKTTLHYTTLHYTTQDLDYTRTQVHKKKRKQ